MFDLDKSICLATAPGDDPLAAAARLALAHFAAAALSHGDMEERLHRIKALLAVGPGGTKRTQSSFDARVAEEIRYTVAKASELLLVVMGWRGAGNSYDLELRVQSEDRAHRIGQTNKVIYVDLIAPGTIDEKIVKSLRAKINVADQIMGEAARDWLL